MRTSQYLNIDRLEYIVTHQCSGKCAHCSLGERLNQPGGERHVRAQEGVLALQRLCEHFPVSSVMTFGGEPLLYPEETCAFHTAARDYGVPERQVITNGYFTREEHRCREVAGMLAASGVTNLLLSVDAFHQADIPLDAVRVFAAAAKDAGIPKLRLHPAWVVNQEHENPYNAATREILAQLADLDIRVSGGNDIFLAGRAAENLAEYYPLPCLDLQGKCGSMPYTQPLTEITSLSIEPSGDVMVCGFIIGNIYRENMGEILRRYDPHENVYMRALLTGGVEALLETARENSIAVSPKGCTSPCDLCHIISKQIR